MPERTGLKTIASKLLSSGGADVLIGYEAGALPLSAAPLIVHAGGAGTETVGADTDNLIFDARCSVNLVNLLHKFKDRKAAVVVKGCDSRSLAGLLQEKQLARENLVVIGAPCRGVIDLHSLFKQLGGNTPSSAVIDGDRVEAVVRGSGKTFPLSDIIHAGCRRCPAHNPVTADYLIADPVEEPDAPSASAELEAAGRMSQVERWNKFRGEMKKCIMCYACRNVCPACYCRECFADASRPRLHGRTDDPADAMFFHMLRLMHLGGRCTGCGACVRACPAGVDLSLYNDFLREFMKKEYAFEAGADESTEPPLACYEQGDPNAFVM